MFRYHITFATYSQIKMYQCTLNEGLLGKQCDITEATLNKMFFLLFYIKSHPNPLSFVR